MRKVWQILIITILMMTLMVPVSMMAAESDDYAWVLLEIEDLDNKEKFASRNENNNYDHKGNYSRNNFSIKWTYNGKTDTYYDPDKVNGESITFNASFSNPPQVIKAGEEISINLSLSAGGNSLSFFTPSGSARAQIGKSGSGYKDFVNGDKKGSFITNSKNSYTSFNETLTATALGGKEGDKLEIRFYLYCVEMLETIYIYEWKRIEDTPADIGDSSSDVVQDNPEQVEEEKSSNEADKNEDEGGWEKAYVGEPLFPEAEDGWREGHIFDVPKTPEGEYIDSGARFQDAYGEVLIRRGDNNLTWEALEPDSPIYVGDVIKTSYDSRAQISLDDLTTFTIREETRIVVDTMSPEQNKLALLAGKIITNVKKMVETGEFQYNTHEAVAGIKGTTFVLEEDGTTSTLKVMEGTVEFTPYGKEAITVTSEETVSVTDGTPSQIEKFSISEELSSWDKDTQEEYIEILAEKGITIEDTDSMESEKAADESEKIDYNFEEKIAEHESHVQRQSFLKYLLWIVILGGAGVFVYMKKKS